MGILDNWKSIVVIAVFGIIGLTIINNQIYFSIFLIMTMFIGLVVFLYMQKKKVVLRPLDLRREQLLAQANQPGTPLKWLVLSGGKDKKRYYGRVVLGKIRGWTKIHIPSLAKSKGGKPWSELYIFRYIPRKPGIIGSITYLIFSIPPLGSFRKHELFAVNNEQLGSNSTTGGDIVILGTSIDTVGIFSMLSTPDLDKEVMYSFFGDEVYRLTLHEFLNRLPEIVDDSIKSSPLHQKAMQMVHGNSEDFGIRT